MKKLIPFLALTFLVQSLFAISPEKPVALLKHLSEVNKEWLNKAVDKNLYGIINFPSDEVRIQKHLELVGQYLSQANASHLAPLQYNKRLEMLDILQQYRERGQFPRNTFHSYRIPYFIDIHGIACAVGYLIIQSGYGELAEKIKNEGNYRYLSDIHYPELLLWAEEHGFSINELAWIQPTYPSDIRFKSIGGGVNGEVDHVIRMSNNPLKILLTGSFTEAGGVPCNGIALWDGISYSCPIPGVQGKVENYIDGYHTTLAGSFYKDDAYYNIIRYNNGNWLYENILAEKSAVITALAGTFDKYASGFYMNGTSKTYFLASKKYNASEWNEVARLNGRINTMSMYHSGVALGGEFTHVNNIPVNHVAFYDYTGQILALENGLDAPVKVLKTFGLDLYAGGPIQNMYREQKFGLARFVNEQWQLMLGSSNYMYLYDTTESYINAIEMRNNSEIIFGGEFSINTIMYSGMNIGIYQVIGSYISHFGLPDGPVNSIYIDPDSRVYIGGKFSNYENFAMHGNPLGINQHWQAQAKIFPNPADDKVSIELKERIVNPSIKVLTVEGRRLEAGYTIEGNKISIDRSGLPPGIYHVMVYSNHLPTVNYRVVFK